MADAAMAETDAVMRRYLFKLYPSTEQAAVLHEQRRMMGDLWNALKQRIEDVYRREGKMLSYFDLTNEITELRHECPEWQAIPAVTAHRVAKWLVDAYRAFFRRLRAGEAPGYPRWQRRERSGTIPLGTMSKTGWQLQQRRDNPLSWRLHYKSVTEAKAPAGWIHCRGRLPAPAEDWRNADIIWRDGRWWLSVGVRVEPRRRPGKVPVIVEFDLVDCTARVNNRPSWLPDFERLIALQLELAEHQAARDARWPRGRRRDDAEEVAFRTAGDAIAALAARLARRRRNALHVWTARLVAAASDLTIQTPKTGDVIRSPRGDAAHWGAHIAPVSALNRLILAQAPATAVAMLAYKAAEAGIRCDIVADPAPKSAVGQELVAAGKTARRARRKLKEAA